jgi:hypothetical protein
VEQELLTLPEHLSSPPVFSGVRVTRSLVFSVVFCRSLCVCPVVLFLSVIVLHLSSYAMLLCNNMLYYEQTNGQNLFLICLVLLN